MFSNLPLPKPGHEVLAEGFSKMLDRMMKQRELQNEEPLNAAKTEEAKANANQKNMLANLMNIAQDGQGLNSTSNDIHPSQLTGTSSQSNNTSSSNQSQSSNRANKAKEVLQQLGYWKETPSEQQKREIETKYQGALAESDVKKISQLEDVAQAGIEAEPTYQEAAKVISNPEWAKMRDFSLAPGYQLEYYKRTGTPEQKKLITDFQSNANQFILNSIKKFPQRFTNSDLNFMRTMKINDNDSFEAAQSKLANAYAYDKILSERAGIAAQIAREKRIPVFEAMKLANKQMNIDKIRNDINESIKTKKKDKVSVDTDNEKNSSEKTKTIGNIKYIRGNDGAWYQ